MVRITLFAVLMELVFFLIFASSYSAKDGGFIFGAAVGFWGCLLTPICFGFTILWKVLDFLKVDEPPPRTPPDSRPLP